MTTTRISAPRTAHDATAPDDTAPDDGLAFVGNIAFVCLLSAPLWGAVALHGWVL